MGSTMLFAGLILLLQNGCFLAQKFPTPPKITGSYMAMGELVESMSSDVQVKVVNGANLLTAAEKPEVTAAGEKPEVDTFQARFEETFDAETSNAAFTFYELDFNITIIEEARLDQTFAFIDKDCKLMTAEEWVKNEAPPSFMGYNYKDGKIKFALRQLFQLPDDKLVPDLAGKSTNYRGVLAVSWVYNMTLPPENGNKTQVNVYAYWTAKTVPTTSKPGLQIPLGYRIIKLVTDKMNKKVHSSDQYVNVFGFVRDAVDRKAFEPKEGINCPDRKESYPFPQLSKSKALIFSAEVVLPDYQEIKNIAVLYDTAKGFLRVDLDRLKGQDPTSKTKTYSSQIISKNYGPNGIVFPFEVSKRGFTCNPYDVQKYQMDLQEVVNPKLDLKFWSLDYLLGRNTTKYVYIGTTVKRSIPCHIFQAYRNDWPDDGSKTKSLWEWCVAGNVTGSDKEPIKFRDDEIGIINAQVKIIESSDKDYVGYKLIFHFHDFLGEEPRNPTTSYDISRCFKRDNKKFLEFIVDLQLTKDNIDGVKNVTNDVAFLAKWNTAILEKAKLAFASLRVAQLYSTVFNNQLYVNFILLGNHPDLKNIDSVTLDSAFNSLKSAVDKGELIIKHEIIKGQGMKTVTAQKGSLSEIINQEIVPTVSPITIPTQLTTSKTPRTLIPFTLDTANPTRDGKITGSTKDGTGSTKDGTGSTKDGTGTTAKPRENEIRFEGHTSGTAAGVSIAMIIIGMTIGAGGTFYKFRGIRTV